MIISAITIENFKSIKEPVRIELKPITLLFGPNSAGKSTVLQVLNYAREIMETSRVNIDQTDTGGDTIRLNSFSNIVHNHNLSKAIRLRFDLDVQEHIRESPSEIDEQLETVGEILSFYQRDAERIYRYYREQIKEKKLPWFELVIQQNSLKEEPYISSATTGIGDDILIVLCVTEKFEKKLKYVNYDHEIFPVIDGQSIGSYFVSGKPCDGEHFFDPTCDFPSPPLPGCVFPLRASNTLLDRAAEDIISLRFRLGTILKAIWETHRTTVKNDLSDFRYLGPLREIPDVKFDPNDKKSKNWANGLAAWANMCLGSDYDITLINQCFSECLGTEYEIIRRQYKELNINSLLYQNLVESDPTKSRNEIEIELEKLPVKSRIYIKQTHNDIELQPKDIGVGISQVLPIIPLALGGSLNHLGIIAIEQPELHIHPAMQVGLADVFIEGLNFENNGADRKRFILETHSEHIILRLLRRIRDPKEGAFYDLTADDLSIYFLEPSKKGMKATRIRVNEDGEFKDPWPRGFFNERSEELF